MIELIHVLVKVVEIDLNHIKNPRICIRSDFEVIYKRGSVLDRKKRHPVYGTSFLERITAVKTLLRLLLYCS